MTPTHTSEQELASAYATLRRGLLASIRYKVRDAQVMSFWMTPQLNRLFSAYISENGGHVKALVIALNR